MSAVMGSLVKTGTPLDSLAGGLRGGSLNLIYGVSGCGKTTLLLHACRNIIKSGKKVIYVDTEAAIPREEFGQGGMVLHANSLKEQKDVVKEAARFMRDKEVGLVVIDTFTGHYHRHVMSVQPEFRAKVGGDLTGLLVSQLRLLRSAVRPDSAVVATAHLRSMVDRAMRETMLRKIKRQVEKGEYIPSISDYEKYFERRFGWIGGHGLGIHTQHHFRMFIDEDGSRIVMVEKWPALPNYAVRFVLTEEGLRQVGERFLMSRDMIRRLAGREVEAVITEAGEEAAEKPREKRARGPEVFSVDELVEREG